MEIRAKRFKELTTQELYDILQLRSEVFVVEQDCVYQDLDGKDQKAIHIIGQKMDKVVAYTRIFKPWDYFETAAIGRVVVKEEERKHKYGHTIMLASINYLEEEWGVDKITLSAQTYLLRFYENLGFEKKGNEYLEDGIPHIKMVRTKS